MLAHTAGGSGLFTSTTPEMRRVRVNDNGRLKLKIVYVVLEAQYQSALDEAVRNLNAQNKDVSACDAGPQF